MVEKGPALGEDSPGPSHPAMSPSEAPLLSRDNWRLQGEGEASPGARVLTCQLDSCQARFHEKAWGQGCCPCRDTPSGGRPPLDGKEQHQQRRPLTHPCLGTGLMPCRQPLPPLTAAHATCGPESSQAMGGFANPAQCGQCSVQPRGPGGGQCA